MTIEQIWEALKQGKTVHWNNKAYKIYIEDSSREYQDKHFTNRNGKVLAARCIENYFGSLLTEECLGNCFIA